MHNANAWRAESVNVQALGSGRLRLYVGRGGDWSVAVDGDIRESGQAADVEAAKRDAETAMGPSLVELMAEARR